MPTTKLQDTTGDFEHSAGSDAATVEEAAENTATCKEKEVAPENSPSEEMSLDAITSKRRLEDLARDYTAEAGCPAAVGPNSSSRGANGASCIDPDGCDSFTGTSEAASQQPEGAGSSGGSHSRRDCSHSLDTYFVCFPEPQTCACWPVEILCWEGAASQNWRRTLLETTANIMKDLMGHSVQVLFSLYGRKGKRPFSGRQLCRVATNAICEKQAVDKTTALAVIGKWLPGSVDRGGGRKRRFAATIAEPSAQSYAQLSAQPSAQPSALSTAEPSADPS
ncbi:uncharacterized protein LOC115324310 [Ixodes scapularis]|uniref:uncharacterized protein LOC115324310 n=1 Tax=Ixodes scapularis TaxID=6945 RepID=UPI001A9EFB52|nr:uncharacterized protein LOC115324310 [Ixodes scapularis]